MKTTTILAAAAVSISVAAAAHSTAKEIAPDISDPITLRMNVMQNVVAATKLGGQMAKGEAPYDARLAATAFRVMNAAALGFASMFPEGSDKGHETEASPKIWSDRAGFDSAIEKFIADTAAAAKAAPADLDAFKPVFGQVVQNCKGCHEDYRIKKN